MPAPTARWTLAVAILLIPAAIARSAEPLSGPELYTQKIKPLLAEKCITCHGALRAEAGLRLDAIQLVRKGSDSGAITRSSGTAQRCVLLERVATTDGELRMPPEGEGAAVDAEQLAWLNVWIAQGLPGPEAESFLTGPSDHWAYQPIARPELPLPNATTAADSAIDRLVFAAQTQRNLRAVNAASPADWVRRVAFDLTGLPPTRESLEQIALEDSMEARTRLVERLLASPSYGQRWGRHWMDVWRYSDWDGYQNELRGSQRHIWHWRDWIVESLNSNKPYDQMVIEMLAADEVAPTDADALRATGFLARNFHISNRDIWLDAAVEHTTKAFLGMTVQCARCHDHKYDPISQEHFYQFRALFEPHRTRTDQVAGVTDIALAGIPRVFDAEPNAETFVYERGNEKLPRKDKPMRPAVVDWIPAKLEIFPVDLPRDSYYPELSELVRSNAIAAKTRAEAAAREELEKITATGEASAAAENEQRLKLAALKAEFATADRESLEARYAADTAKYSLGAVEHLPFAREAAVKEHRRQRLELMQTAAIKQAAVANAEQSAEKDEGKRKAALDSATQALHDAQKKLSEHPDLAADSIAYSAVGKELPKQSTGRRLALAKWIVDPNNPLTARVAINHIWLRHFGTPLVENVFDFGMKAPQPELLDVLNWLSAELIASGWDMKHIHRLMVLSKVYGLASDDVDVLRREQNMIVDADNRFYWRSNVRRLDAEEVRDNLLTAGGCLDATFSGPDIDYEKGEEVYRRSIYFRHAYEKQMSMLVLFDAASPGDCYRRKPSVIPQQALALANSGMTRSMSRLLARDLELQTAGDEVAFIDRLYKQTLNRPPTAAEIAKCREFLVEQQRRLSAPEQLTPLVSAGQAVVPAASDAAQRARESLSLVLLNHNDFVTVR